MRLSAYGKRSPIRPAFREGYNVELIIRINLDNAAFADYPGDAAAEILRRQCATVLGGLTRDDIAADWAHSLRDGNGNRVGTIEVTS